MRVNRHRIEFLENVIEDFLHATLFVARLDEMQPATLHRLAQLQKQAERAKVKHIPIQ